MQTIIKLTNGIKVGIIGNHYPIMFDDNTMVKEDIFNKFEVSIVTDKLSLTKINEHTVSVGIGHMELNLWVKQDIDQLVIKYLNKEVDVLLSIQSLMTLAYDYINDFYPQVPIYVPNILESEDTIMVASINSFFKYEPNTI